MAFLSGVASHAGKGSGPSISAQSSLSWRQALWDRLKTHMWRNASWVQGKASGVGLGGGLGGRVLEVRKTKRASSEGPSGAGWRQAGCHLNNIISSARQRTITGVHFTTWAAVSLSAIPRNKLARSQAGHLCCHGEEVIRATLAFFSLDAEPDDQGQRWWWWCRCCCRGRRLSWVMIAFMHIQPTPLLLCPWQKKRRRSTFSVYIQDIKGPIIIPILRFFCGPRLQQSSLASLIIQKTL